jgi:glucokinase
MSDPLVIGVDLGGTKIAAGLVDGDGGVQERREWLTPTESQEALLDALDEAVGELLGADVVAVGIGVPSVIDRTTGRALGSVNIPLDDVDLDDRLRGRFGLPVAIENDANAAALAEWRFGAGQGSSSMVMLTLGTGVGGGVVFGGQLLRGLAEFGHIVIEHDGRPCQGRCTGRGHLEAYVSGTAATAAARAAFGPAADAYRLVRLANEGDAQAVGILRDIGERLGSGIGTLVNVFDPELVVIGGGFAAAGDLVLEPARAILRREAIGPAKDRVQIVRAKLGTAAGIVGAALVGLEAAAA